MDDQESGGRTHNPLRPRNLPVLITGVIGTSLSVLMFLWVHLWTQERIQLDFERRAGDLAVAIEQRINESIEVLHSIRSFYEVSGRFDRRQFHGFSQRLISRHPGIQAIEWIPRVPDVERAAYEAAARRDGYPHFRITTRQGQGQMIRSGPRAEYFPVYYVEPFQGNEIALGFDLAANSVCLEALTQARDAGIPVATARIVLVQETGEQYGFLIFVPIFRPGAAPETVEARRESLLGFALGVYRIGDLVEAALRGLDTASMTISVHDESAAPDDRALYRHPPGGREPAVRGAGDIQGNSVRGFQWRKSFDVAGRRWALSFGSAPLSPRAHKTWPPWIALGAGLLLTVILAAYLRLGIDRSYRLAATKEMLETEIAKRKQMGSALQEAHESLQAVFQASPLAINALDRDGTVRMWNPAAARIFGWEPEEVLGHLPPHIPAEEQEESRRVFERAVRGEAVAGVELRRRRRDGSPVDISLWTAPLRDAAGTITGVLGVIADITERKRAEGALARRTHQLEAVRRVSEEITRELDLRAVLNLITRRAVDLVGAASGMLRLWDEGAGLLVPQGWVGPGEGRGTLALRLGEGVAGTAAQLHQGLLVNDFRQSAYATPLLLDRTTHAAVLAEPLLYRDRLVGVINLNREESDRPFAEEDRQLLALFAAQAAIALENARLHEATIQQLAELRDLHDMSRAIASSMTLDEQLEILIERLGQAAGSQRILVGLLNSGDATRFRLCRAYDASRAEPWIRHLDLSPDRYPEIQEVVRTGRPLVIPDVATEPLLASVQGSLERVDLRSLVVLPLVVRERTIGAVSLGYLRQRRSVTEEELSRLQSFIAQAGIAIHQAHLYEQLRCWATLLEAKVEERTKELQVTNRKLQEATRLAEEASRHKSDFLANMSHEIREPLNAVIGFSELLRNQRVGALTEKQTRYITHIWNSGKHLLQLIGDILDLSKVEAGKLTLKSEPLSVVEALQDILVIARGLANKKSQDLHMEIASDLPPLTADPVRFKQILFNLLSNAVKFTPEHGTIMLTVQPMNGTQSIGAAARPGGEAVSQAGQEVPDRNRLSPGPLSPGMSAPSSWLEIRVTDSGIGIKAEDLPRLFQEFVQLETTHPHEQEGTGLGLALTKRLVELHGGRIWAESEGAGKGSTFTALLPYGQRKT